MKRNILTLAAWVAAASAVSAAEPVFTTTAWTSPFAVSSTDLLQTALVGAPVISGTFSNFLGGGSLEALLRDGQAGGPEAANPFAAGYVAVGSNASVTYALDLVASPAGYDLLNIQTFAAWDEGRDRQDIAISYATVADPTTFIALISYSFDPPEGLPFSGVSVTPGAGDAFLAQGVAAIRFTFPDQENGTGAYRELDVIGVSAVPEPATWALMLGGAALLAWRRRAAA